MICSSCNKNNSILKMSTVILDGFLMYFCNPKCKEQYLKERADHESKRTAKHTTENET